MNYEGERFPIPLGQMGLFTDAAQCNIPSTALIRANNVTFYNSVLQKDFGSRIWNQTPLPASVVRAKEFFPDPFSQKQRVIALCSNGNLYKFTDRTTYSVLGPQSLTDPSSLNAIGYNQIITGGNELAGRNKKAFVFTGRDLPQVVSGDATVRYSISKPAADWTGTNQPFAGIIHRGKLFCWGNANNPHAIYASSGTDHEDFQTFGNTQIFSVFPGEYDGIVCGLVFRGRLYVLKYPLGLYYLVDDDSNIDNWYFAKQSDDFGAASPQSAAIVGDDALIANEYGSISSLKAALIFGDLLQKDLFYNLNCYRFAEQEVRPDQHVNRSMIYYSARKQLFTAFQSYYGNSNDRISVIDFKDQTLPPKAYWVTKDQPNCLFTMRDSVGVQRPFYGSSDGNIYQMGSADRWVGDATDTTRQTAYTFDAQTPHIDFGTGGAYNPLGTNAAISTQMKTFEFLEVHYEPTGDWDVNIDVFVDGVMRHTYTCNLSARSNLSEMPLNSSPIDGLAGFFRRFPIHGQGRTISLRFYNGGLGQDVRLIKAVIYYRPSGQQQMVT